MGEGAYYSNENKSLDDFTTQKSTTSEDQETTELSLYPPNTRHASSSYFNQESKKRKRREKLSQMFVELSAILPGLKKVDKASILEQAIKCVKELQEKVQLLEEQKNTSRSIMFVNKFQLEEEDDNYSSSDEINSHGSIITDDIPLDIESRFSDKNVLITITCARRTGFLLKMYDEIEKLHLTIVNSSMMPFGKHANHVIIVAQMDDCFSMALKDVVKHVQIVTGRLLNQA